MNGLLRYEFRKQWTTSDGLEILGLHWEYMKIAVLNFN
jgi:hypothetical protein